MNFERSKYKSKLTAKEFDLKKMEMRIATLRDALRDLLDPFIPIKDLRGEQITDHALEFAMLQIEYNQTAAEITSIKDALED
jgi:hypothetical protein